MISQGAAESDLVVHAEDAHGPYVIAVEAKADELERRDLRPFQSTWRAPRLGDRGPVCGESHTECAFGTLGAELRGHTSLRVVVERGGGLPPGIRQLGYGRASATQVWPPAVAQTWRPHGDSNPQCSPALGSAGLI